MMSLKALVQEVLARHTRRRTAAILPSLHLQRDLHIHPLELALVVVDLEEIVGVRMNFGELALVRTVGELVSSVLSEALAQGR